MTSTASTTSSRRPRQIFKYSYFVGMSPLCPSRLRDYPELRKPISEMDASEMEDAQHQWAYTCSSAVMQRCFESDCHAVRPVPMHGHSPENQNFILLSYYRWLQGEVGGPLPDGQVLRHV